MYIPISLFSTYCSLFFLLRGFTKGLTNWLMKTKKLKDRTIRYSNSGSSHSLFPSPKYPNRNKRRSRAIFQIHRRTCHCHCQSVVVAGVEGATFFEKFGWAWGEIFGILLGRIRVLHRQQGLVQGGSGWWECHRHGVGGEERRQGRLFWFVWRFLIGFFTYTS